MNYSELPRRMRSLGTARVAHATRSHAEANATYRAARHGNVEQLLDDAVNTGDIISYDRRGGLYDIAITPDLEISVPAQRVAVALNMAGKLDRRTAAIA